MEQSEATEMTRSERRIGEVHGILDWLWGLMQNDDFDVKEHLEAARIYLEYYRFLKSLPESP